MYSVLSALFLASASAQNLNCDSKQFSDPSKPCFLTERLALPYPVKWVLRGFDQCRKGKHKHQAVDIGGLGPEYGLGDPVRSMVKSKVIFVGRRSQKPKRFGRPNLRSKTVKRHGRELPAFKNIEGYGKVHFFTLDYGSSRTGEFLAVKALEAPYVDHEFRYMHMGAIRPDIKVGTILEAGEVFGVMGGTAIMESPPHLPVDISDPKGKRLDVMPILGLESRHKPCGKSVSQPIHSKAVTSKGNAKPKVNAAPKKDLKAKKSSETKNVTSAVTKTGSNTPSTHRIEQGETLSSIAMQYNVSVKAIMKLNNLSDPDRIREGQALSLPKPNPPSPKEKIDTKKWRIHTISQGEHLSLIAMKYKCSVEDLMRWNSLKNDKIYEGDVLKIAR